MYLWKVKAVDRRRNPAMSGQRLPVLHLPQTIRQRENGTRVRLEGGPDLKLRMDDQETSKLDSAR